MMNIQERRNECNKLVNGIKSERAMEAADPISSQNYVVEKASIYLYYSETDQNAEW